MSRFRILVLLTLVIIIAACGDDSIDPVGEQPSTSELDCEQFGYPCSIADTPPEVLEAALDLLDDAWAQRYEGTMAETLTWLENHPEVIEVTGDDSYIRFRIEGCVPVWLTDTTELTKSSPLPRPDKGIIGEDTNQDEVIDNRDQKRALVMAPYYWQFEPYDESDLLAGQMESLRGYTGNITYKSNPDTTDQNIILDDYLHWNEYDLIYLSTHGARLVDSEKNFAWVVVSTGILWEIEQTNLTLPGVVLMGAFNGRQSRQVTELGLTSDFFRSAYPLGLDQAMVILSACQTGGAAGNDLAHSMEGEDFVMFGWSEVVDTDDAFAAMSVLLENLGEGLNVQAALAAVDDAGLRSVVNSNSILTSLQAFADIGGVQRLFELPQLLDDDDDVLTDGVDLSSRVIGTIGDGNSDGLALTVEVDGVMADDLNDFQLHYRYDGNDLAGTFDLSGATQTSSFRYKVSHDVDLGRDVEPSADIPLEVVVDLPEGGQSRFRVDVEFSESGSGEIHECIDYPPTPSGGSQGGIWGDQDAIGYAAFSGPQDPGGGFWTVTASCEDPVNIQLVVLNGSGPATIFSESNQGTIDPQSLTAIFEAGAGMGYNLEARQAVSTSEEEYPINWSLSWAFTSLVDCYEPNQNSTQAKQLPANIDNVSAYMVGGYRDNALHSEDYDDWYKLVVDEPSNLTVDLTQCPNDIRIRMRLWGLNDNQLAAAGSNESGGLATLTYEAQPGTYFLSIEAAGLGDGAVNTLFDETPDHLASPYIMSVATEALQK